MTFLVASVCVLTKPQAQISFRFNFGMQPIWGPVGYDKVDYYYLPDIETYYNLSEKKYTYQLNGKWITSFSLPPNHQDYDLYAGHKVVMNGARPYDHDAINRERYARFKNKHDQHVIRDSKDSRYYENKEHPRHSEWKENGHDNRDKNKHGGKEEGYGDNKGDKQGKGRD